MPIVNRLTPRRAWLAAALAGAMLVGACAEPTAYRPATGTGMSREGYSDQEIEPGRFMVTFSGNSYTSRDTVERYLLYRAAQLTLQQGYDYFVLTNRDTQRSSQTYVDRPFGPGPYGYWGPSWRYYGRGFGWRSWSPFYGDPFWDNQIDVRTVDRYEASAEIVLGRGPKPATNLRAFDARGVIDRIGPSIVAPH